MGRSNKDARPDFSHDTQDQTAGHWPLVGHGEPMTNQESSAESGAGVDAASNAPKPKPSGEGPSDNDPDEDAPEPSRK
jgi:hypothetical protein